MFKRYRTKKTALLEELPLFRGITPQHLQLIEQYADQAVFPAGTVIAYPSHLGREFVLVHEGILRVEASGRLTGRLYPGDFFGELSVLARKPRTATVIAETPASLIVVEARAFLFLLEAVPAIQRRILEGLSYHLGQADAAPLLAQAS